MADVHIHAINASFIAVVTEDPGIKEDLYQFFRFEEPTFTPNKYSKWDGVVRLYDKKHGKMAYGLFSTVIQFCKDRGLTFTFDDAFKGDIKPVNREEINAWVDGLNLRSGGNVIDAYDYQREGLFLAIRYSRMTLLAATSAGKSLLQYLIIRFLMESGMKKILLVVPSINLVSQMVSDFADYSSANGWDAEANCHMVFEGRSPYTTKPITVATWQSLKDLDAEFFHQFNALLGDEAHLFSGACLEAIGKNCVNAYNRIGMTGTLKKEKLHPLQIQQHFGPIKRIVSTKELQDAGRAAKTLVTMVQIEHTTDFRQALYEDGDYQKEIEALINDPFRNKVIKSLAKVCKGNTLMLFDRVEKHLEIIAEGLKQEMPDRQVLVITGNVDNDDRNIIKAEMENGENIVLLASYGTMSTGVSIKKLHNLVFCHPSKSVIRVLQSLGRLLRLHDTKEVANIYDLVDVGSYMGRLNHAMRHASERLGFYQDEQHQVAVKRFYAPDSKVTTTRLV